MIPTNEELGTAVLVMLQKLDIAQSTVIPNTIRAKDRKPAVLAWHEFHAARKTVEALIKSQQAELSQREQVTSGVTPGGSLFVTGAASENPSATFDLNPAKCTANCDSTHKVSCTSFVGCTKHIGCDYCDSCDHHRDCHEGGKHESI
jgi:hypothetical protein